MTSFRLWCLRVSGFSLAVPAVFGLLVAPPQAAAQSRERILYVSALDAKTGKPVDTLSPADVIVREDGVAREVLRVTPATDPMQIAILVDNSAVAAPEISNIRDGLKAFFSAIGDGHEISLVTYAERPTLLASFSQSRAALEKALGLVYAPANSGAYMLEAILETSRGFVKRRATRPVIVVMAIEGVEFSSRGYEVVLEALAESGAQMHVLLLTKPGVDDTNEKRDRSIVIDRGTRQSGGRRENLLTSMALPSTLTAVAEELTHQFKAVYVRPEALIPPKRVEVSSARSDLQVRGSSAPTPAPATP